MTQTCMKLPDGNFAIDATQDVITCVRCRWAVPVGRVCRCPQRTLGPSSESQIRELAGGKEWRPEQVNDGVA